MNLLPQTLAQADAAPAQQGSPLQFPIMMVILFAIMYFMMIRPQRRREKERKAMIAGVKSGSRVLLASGIIGQIINVKENTLVVRIAENTKVEVVKSAISQVMEKGDALAEVEPAK